MSSIISHNTANTGYYGVNSFHQHPNAKRAIIPITEGHNVISHQPPVDTRVRINDTYTSHVFTGPEATYKPAKKPVPSHPMDNNPIHHHPRDQLMNMNQRPPNFRRGRSDDFKDKITYSDAFGNINARFPGESPGQLNQRASRNKSNHSSMFSDNCGQAPKKIVPRLNNPTFVSHTKHYNFSDLSNEKVKIGPRRIRAKEECYRDEVKFSSSKKIPSQHPSNIRRNDPRAVRAKAEYAEKDGIFRSRVLDTTSPPTPYHPQRNPGGGQYMHPRSIVFDRAEPPRRRQLGQAPKHVSKDNLNMRDEPLVSRNIAATYVSKHSEKTLNKLKTTYNLLITIIIQTHILTFLKLA